MRSKRLFAILLAFCMVFTALVPAASAVAAPRMSVIGQQETAKKNEATKIETSPNANGLLVSEQDGYKTGLSMRDESKLQVEVNNSDDDSNKVNWEVKPSQGEPTVSLLPNDLDKTLEELRAASELYNVDEVVYAFVVMEDKPLAESYTSRALVSADLEKQMLQKQDAVISAIERTVLSGQKLEVRYQFTYLTNAFTIKTAFGNLEKIAGMQGVKRVFLTPVFEPTAANPNTYASGAMTGVHTVWEDLGYTGTGMKIAIIDTGLDLDHPSFAADPETNENSLTKADIAAVLQDLNAFARRNIITADTLYRSAKVPFAFNYVDGNLTADHSMDGQGDHGTHVAGIAAANATEGTSVVGMAPDAQIIVMKVFGAAGGAYMDDVAAALEDAMTLGCDVVNASLGSARGFSESSSEEINLIYERLASQDIVATFSAGNDGTSSYANTWGTDMNRTQNPDNATIGSPSTWANTLSIASAENCEIQTPFFALADGTKVFFTGTYQWAMGEVPGMEQIIGMELEYVMIDGLGEPEDFYDDEGNSLVEGKVAVVSRGVLGFGNKIYNAENAGAVACVIANNNADDIYSFYMNIEITDEYGDPFYPYIPACMIMMEDAEKMAAAEVKTMTVSEQPAPRATEGGQMSSFSSWGVTPDLQLMPDITGIGGNVFSTVDNGQYGVMSGTSMSAPQIAGVTALVMQHLYTIYPDAPNGTIRDLVEAILMSTADPIVSSGSGVEASPRQQGAGLVNAAEATTTTTYLTVGGGRPKAELGDNPNGKYTFSFEIHNFGTEDKTYTMGSSLLTEYVTGLRLSATEVEYFMLGENVSLSGDVNFDKNSVTVPAGGRANVTVSIALSDSDKAYFAQAWENGGYVEGFVYLFNEEGLAELNLPFLGFYGDWTEAPIFDTAYWYDNSFWSVPPANGLPEGDEYYNVIWTDLGGQDWVLGMNPYSGATVDRNGNVVYDPAHNVLSPNGDGVLDGIAEIYLSLMRNAKTLVFNYTIDGELVHQEIIEDAQKTMYISAYGQIVPWIHSWYGWDLYDFTDANGKALPSGTEVLLTIDGYIDYGNGGSHSIQIPFIVDTVAPELVDVYEMPQQNGDHYLFVEMSENIAPASVVLMNPSGTQILAQGFSFQDSGAGTYLMGFDITDMGTEFMVALCDYACNESYFDIKYSAAPDGNLPEMDTTALYGYRVHDDHLMSDHMYGWISTNKPVEGAYADVNVLTDDYLEYASFTAAEYVGGKVFAVDAVYNFVVLDPGLWNRTNICNLGVNVIDMAFDDTTDTMYALVKESSYTYLYTLDLLTGEMTELLRFGYYNRAPWAITFDAEGTMYAIQIGSSNLFTVNKETGSMTAMTDAEGNTFVMTDSEGAKISPTAYSQSITYSEAENTIYWAHFNYSYYGSTSGMVSINLDDLTTVYNSHRGRALDASNQVVTYYPATEIVGLMVLEDTEYTLPEATELSGIVLDAENVVLTIGESAKVKASPAPWNYELKNVNWSSSDESVASVVGGEIIGVGEGTAVITASVGDVTAEVTVTVVDISGNFYAYNYYSGDNNYGYMISVDMASMNYSLLGESNADFLAGDYNGNDGYFYSYTEGGQLWRMDMQSGETVALGDPIGANPSDMAYDYSTGLMYAVVADGMTGVSTINAVNMTNGKLVKLGEFQGIILMTLACDLEGNLYGIDYSGMMFKMWFEEGYLTGEPVLEGLGELSYMQSMCYDFNNDVIIWACPETFNIYWIDVKAAQPFVVALGDPTGAGFQFTGLFTVPAETPALPQVAVESVSAEDIMIFAGATKFANTTILPLNATSNAFAWTSSDESIVKVYADGSLTGVAAGTATVSGTLTDAVSGEVFEASFQVTVIAPADNLYGHVLTDLATYNGYYWARMYPTLPSSPDILGQTDHVMYAEEYYNGKLYAFGYDPNIWEGASWSMFILNPVTQTIEEKILMDETFPFVYDMTYDYNTSTMYAMAGPSENDADLYIVNMETGELTLFMETSEFFMSIAAGPEGKLYAIENSQEEFLGYDDWGWEIYGYGNAKLYAIDPLTKTVEFVGDTGIKSNMIASMTYDYDTGMLYWTPVFRESFYSPLNSCLAMVDPATANAYNLGMIGTAGAQVSGLYVICDEFPAEPDPALLGLVMSPVKADLVVGQSTELNAITIPMTVDANITWSSSDIDVVTVDENGVITAVGQGSAVVTATAVYNGVKMTAECRVAILAEDAVFLTYNLTDGGWAEISRADGEIVTNLTEGETTAVAAFTNMNGTIYGYDVENNLFKLDMSTYEREIIGQIDSAALIEEMLLGYGYSEEEIAEMLPACAFEVRDMDYDVANDRLLILGNVYDVEYGEMTSGNSIYEVNLTDGSITNLYTFHEHYYVMAMTVDTEGTVYFYNIFNDYYSSLNLETGVWKNIISLQSQSYYGTEIVDHALYFDAITGKLYHLFSGNGNYHSLFSVDLVTGAINQEAEYVGETVYDYETWGYLGDLFAGLSFINEDAGSGMPEDPIDPVDGVEWISASASMGGKIGLNFYVSLAASIVNDPTTFVRFTVGNNVVDVPMADALISVEDGETRYRFTVELAVKQIADTVTAQVMNENGTVGTAVNYSLKQYCTNKLSSATMGDLAKALLNYGAAAQMFFNYNTDNLANDVLDEADRILPDVDASAYARKITGSEEGITAESATLMLESEVAVRVYFELAEGANIDDYTFTINGEIVEIQKNETGYYLETAPIAAKNLDEMFEFSVGGLTVTYGALSYVNSKLSSSNENTVYMAKALFAYYQAAEAYFAK